MLKSCHFIVVCSIFFSRIKIILFPRISDFMITLRTKIMFSVDISMFRTNRKSRSNGDIGELILRDNLFHKIFTGFRIRKSFSHIYMQYCSSCIFTLELILIVECFEYIIRKLYRQLRRICVVWIF